MDRRKMKKNRFLLVTVLLIFCIGGAVFVGKKEAVYAKHTLPGIETIASNNGYNDPYIILEVVEDKEDASLGYLIGGEEPIENGKSIKDYSNEDERDKEFPDNIEDFIPDAYLNLNDEAFSWTKINSNEDGSSSADIKGDYVSATNGYYDLVESSADYDLYISGTHDSSAQRYNLYAGFYEEENSSYIPTFKLIEDTLDPFLIDGKLYGNYCKFELNIENKSVALIDATDFTDYIGEAIFDVIGSDYVYKGKIVKSDDGVYYILTPDGIKYLFEYAEPRAGYEILLHEDAIGTYEMVSFSLNSIGGSFYISSFNKATVEGTTDFTYENEYFPSSEGLYIQTILETKEYVYDETSNGDLNWQTDYTKETFATYTYDGGFVNDEWFKKNVFDREVSEIEDLVIDVKTVTMEEFNSYNLDDVDMVYFAGISAGYSNSVGDSVGDSVDLSVDQARNLFTLLKDSNFPIFMNRSVHDLVIKNELSYPNMNKLELLLTQENYDVIDISSADFLNWNTGTYWDDIKNTVRAIDTNFGYNYVNQSFYMYDDTKYDEELDAVPYVNKDFLNLFSDEMVTQGFQVVLDEIKLENFYVDNAGYPVFDFLVEKVTKAAALRYIINYGYKRNVIKDSISVLEIQPCNSFTYTDEQLKVVNTLKDAVEDLTGTVNGEFNLEESPRNTLTVDYIAQTFAKQFIDNTDQITLESMYTGEFIGKIEDLNENYDLIYVGLDTSTMNTKLNKTTPFLRHNPKYIKTSDQTLYNNSNLNGLIYLHAGDYITVNTTDTNFSGLVDPTDHIAFAGNDITLEKYNNLTEYMDAGYPVIFADGFYDVLESSITVNRSKIDSASYMYKIAKYAIDKGYFGKNVNTEGNIKADTMGTGASAMLAKYLNLSKLSISPTVLPVKYDQNMGNPVYLAAENGKYTLTYEFLLKNDAAASIIDTKYDVNLFIDISADGRYSTDEEIENLQVFELKNDEPEQIYLNTAGNFELMAGHYYRVTREVPTGYVGILPWKLVFTQNDNSLVRRSVFGFTAVTIDTTDRVPIEVLQILPTSDDNNWDLKDSVNGVLDLLDDVQEFDITIVQIKANKFINDNSELTAGDNVTDEDIAAYLNALNVYDMLIIGFADTYDFKGENVKKDEAAAKAIRQYISEGRSVLFTHDTTSYHNVGVNEWGYQFNKYVRDIVGQDRYGVLPTEIDTVYDTMWLARGSQSDTSPTYKYIQGFSDSHILRYRLNDFYLPSTRTVVANASESNFDLFKTNEVSEVNSGQITKYPFDIPKSFSIATTHPQYYQLDLDTDSKDTILDDDVVVWYCLSDKNSSLETDDYYQAMPNDARNNYYIYNKGNVTYSGVGHSEVKGEIEKKLFVNTMVAAYSAGVHEPKVVYKEGAGQDAATIDYIYLPYDEVLGEYVDITAPIYDKVTDKDIDTITDIYFDVSDTSFVKGTKEIVASYYLEVDTPPAEGDTKIITVDIDGESRYLKKFTPYFLTNVRIGTPLSGDAIYTLENDSRYKFSLTVDQLSLLSKNRANVYIGAKTIYTGLSGKSLETKVGYYSVSILKTQLFELE